jgi:hypothetical protein
LICAFAAGTTGAMKSTLTTADLSRLERRNIPVEIVEPSVWKRFWRLPGKDKESARQKALQLFPAAHAALARKKDHGRAEASLIALYGAKS